MIKKTWSFLRHNWQFSLAALVAILSLGFQLWGPVAAAHWMLGITSLVLTVPLVVSMWQDFRMGSYGFNILAPIAIIMAVVLHQYWTAIVIVLLITVSKRLEVYAEHRAQSELRALIGRSPVQAHVLRGRKSFDVAASEVHVGDKLVINIGEVVPADAIILEGTSNFDETALTGESHPLSRQEGEQILSGSINLGAMVTAKAINSAADSQYQQLLKFVQGTGAKHAPFVRLANRYSLLFTLTALAVAGSAWIIGHQAIRFLEVIVVATPCPLLLAAPISLISGMGRASRYGIIFKTSAVMEKLAEAETYAFGKTTTLTKGEPRVEAITALKPYSQNEILGLAASLEQASSHVLARAIIQAAQAKHYSYTKAKHVQEFTGRGLRATLHGKEVLVGQLAFLAEYNIDIPKSTSPKQTVSYVAVNGQLAGIITFNDEPRPESKAMLERLKEFGIRHLLMITGDSQLTAEAVAKDLGITQVQAQASAADKLYAIEKLEHRPVVFVGDGVNDAPVLTAANIGIALGARGSTTASESADVVIMSSDISYVAKATSISRRTLSIARQSILMGILLSLGMMLAFATGKFPPLLGAALQEIVVVFVIINSLRAHLTPKSEQ